MNGKILLDTNIIIGLFAADKQILNQIEKTKEVFIPSIALGELYYGAFRSNNIEKNLEKLFSFAASSSVLECDTGTARNYGEIKSILKSKGRPIPENDIWISALAKQYNITLVTRDVHFKSVEDLPIEMW